MSLDPSSRYFKNALPLDYHPDFIKGLNQIDKWRAWFMEPANMESFSKTTVGMMRRPLHENPLGIKYVLVTGRRAECADSSAKRRLIAAKQSDDLKIMSFDSLVEDLDNKRDLYVGVRRNEFLDIISNKFLTENMFVWMSPSHIRISSRMKLDIEANRKCWGDMMMGANGMQSAMERAMKAVHIKSE